MSLTHSYGLMGKRIGESTADDSHGWIFCRSCLQLMTSRNTAVYRYRGIFESASYRRVFLDATHPYLKPPPTSQCSTVVVVSHGTNVSEMITGHQW